MCVCHTFCSKFKGFILYHICILCVYLSGLVCQQSHPLWFSVRLSVTQASSLSAISPSMIFCLSVRLSVTKISRNDWILRCKFFGPSYSKCPKKNIWPIVLVLHVIKTLSISSLITKLNIYNPCKLRRSLSWPYLRLLGWS